MHRDREGFLYPQFDAVRCIRCGLCRKVCPFQDIGSQTINAIEPKVYAVKHKSDSIRMVSSSGGAYTAFSDHVLAKNIKTGVEQFPPAVCYGAAFDAEFNVRHQKAITLLDRDRFRGSKYVQSELNAVFTEIKSNLLTGQRVLFTGTPCQTAGLQKYLGQCQLEQTNFIANDLICHGTPSPLLWQEYRVFLESKNRSELKTYRFRSKATGWEGYLAQAEFVNGRKINMDNLLLYNRLFFTHLGLRPACYHCKFTNTQRPSDITIGDFWGIKKVMPDFFDSLGVSLVLINTSKGQSMFDQIKGMVHYRECKLDDCLPFQHNLRHPTALPPLREKFWRDYVEFGFDYVARKYATDSWGIQIKHWLKQGLRLFVENR